MPFETLLESRQGAVATITLNRPEKLNALNAKLLSELIEAFAALDKDDGVRCAILTGAGEKAFAAGADIAAMAKMSVAEARAFSEMGRTLGAAIEDARFPVIAAVNGLALGGGCELAMACDFLYASENAKFGQPEVNLAVIPGFGGTQRLARRVGIGMARELCMTGDFLSAKDAHRIGLVNLVVPLAELVPKAMATAEKIATKGPVAIRACKRVLHRGQDVPLSQATELESTAFSELFATADQREGMAAFLEKRAAAFQGK
jgi:enoyl-CoA hydratase